MFQRIKSAGSKCKEFTASFLLNVFTYAPIIGFFVVRVGSSAFSSLKFVQYVQHEEKEENSLKTALGLTLVGAAIVGTSGAIITNRIRNLLRNEQKNHHRHANVHPLLQERTATFCHPATAPFSVTYVAAQVNSVLYSIGSGLTGVLGVDTLLKISHIFLLQKQLMLTSECENPLTGLGSIILVHLIYLALCGANAESFRKFNYPNLKKYYEDIFLLGGWKKLPAKNFLESFIGVTIGSISAYFSNKHIVEVLNKNSFCHFNLKVSNQTNKILAGTFAIFNFLTQIQMTLGAKYRKLNHHTRDTLAQSLEIALSLKQHRVPITICIYIDSLVNSLGTFVAIATLPNTMVERKDLIYSSYMISLATIGALITLRNLTELGMESFRIEAHATAKDILSQEQRAEDDIPAIQLGTLNEQPRAPVTTPLSQPLLGNTNDYSDSVVPNNRPPSQAFFKVVVQNERGQQQELHLTSVGAAL